MSRILRTSMRLFHSQRAEATRMPSRPIFILLTAVLLIAAIGLSAGTATAQETGPLANSRSRLGNSRIFGDLDSDIPAPLSGYASKIATNQQAQQQQAQMPQQAGASWQGLEATGTISYGKQGEPLQASLSISASGAERLDVTLSDGVRSLRILGFVGKLKDPQGPVRQLPSRNAIVSFLPPQPFSAHILSADVTTSSLEQTTLGGQRYQRTRYEYRPSEIADPTKRGLPAFATETYTNPATGLVYKSVDYVHSIEPSPVAYVRVITYEEYKTVDGVAVPTKMTQSIDGQLSYTLQLRDIHLSSTRPQVDFTF